MKGWMKGMLIASAVCIGAGTAMCVSAWAMGGRFSQFGHRRIGIVEEETGWAEEVTDELPGGGEVTEGGNSVEGARFGAAQVTGDENQAEAARPGTAQVSEGRAVFNGMSIEELKIQVSGANVEVVRDDTAEDIQIICDNERYQCHQKVDKNTLKLEIERRGKIDRYVLDDIDETGVEIVIPAGSHFREVDLEVSGGVLTVDWVDADSLDMEASGGSLEVLGGTVGNLSSECMAGSVSYEGQVLWEADAECDAGLIRYLLEGSEEDFSYEIDASVGSVVIGGSEVGSVRDDTVIRNPGAAKRSDLECTAGKIEMDFYQQ